MNGPSSQSRFERCQSSCPILQEHSLPLSLPGRKLTRVTPTFRWHARRRQVSQNSRCCPIPNIMNHQYFGTYEIAI